MTESLAISQNVPFVPWYKNFWPWFIIFILSCAVVASLSVVYIAVSHPDGVVRDDWYKEGQAINRTLDRDNKARALGLAAGFKVDDLTGEISLSLSGSLESVPGELELWISHPTQPEKDEHIVMHHTAGNDYVGQLTAKLDGKRYLELSTSTWRLASKIRFPNDGFELHPVN